MSESEAALRNCVNLDQVSDYIMPVQAILSKCSKETLEAIYKIPRFGGATDFLAHVAKKRGKIGHGGVPDYQRAGIINQQP